MSRLLVLLGLAACCAAAFVNPTLLADDTSDLGMMATRVNALGTTWKAERPGRFGSLRDAQVVCGTWTKDHPRYVDNQLPILDLNPNFSSLEIPESFDVRKQWSNCTVMSKVRDQSACGSCWAFGSTEAFEGSRCIATGQDQEFSAMDTAACCSGFSCGLSMGCNGGQPSSALSWMTRTGVVTGGDYFDIGSGSGCMPYSFAPCAHHVPPTDKYPSCPTSDYSTRCTRACSESGYGVSYSEDKTFGSKAFSLRTEEGMQTALMQTGPLAVAFTVYEDFPTYKSGVYKHVAGRALGGHAVLMAGWGVENGQKYWLIKNSWNEMWGDGGFFKIARGVNECGIESDVTGISF